MAAFKSLFGETLVNKAGESVSTTETLSGKVVGIYFSAHWCGPCRQFTPALAKFYTEHAASKNFEIVFASSDRDESSFKEYFGTMPWKALPFDARDAKAALSTKYKVQGIPTLVWLDTDGKLITDEGREKVMGDPAAKAFPWRPKSILDILSGDLAAQRQDGSTLGADDLKAKKYIGFYFSAHWCPPCRAFTPKLSAWYKAQQEKRDDFELVFVSSDRSQSDFDEYHGSMTFPALSFADKTRKQDLSTFFKVQGIPSLQFIDSSTGAIVCADGRARVEADPEGFPWPPKAVEPLSVAVGSINETKMVVLFTDTLTSADAETAVTASLNAVATPLFEKWNAEGKSGSDHDTLFCVAGEDDEPTAMVRQFLGLDKDADGDANARLIVLEIPAGKKYIWPGTGLPSEGDIASFVDGVLSGSAAAVGIKDAVEPLK